MANYLVTLTEEVQGKSKIKQVKVTTPDEASAKAKAVHISKDKWPGFLGIVTKVELVRPRNFAGYEGKQTMAITKEAADKAVLQIIANVKQKFADLDDIDEQFADLDAETPMDGMMDSGIGEQFDLLSDKREELEQEIRSMRERVQLISEWEKFKGGGWSDDVQAELNSLDQQFANIADGAGSVESFGVLPMPDVPLTPDEVTGIPADAPVEPPITAPEPPLESPATPAEPLAAPVASKKAMNQECPQRPTTWG